MHFVAVHELTFMFRSFVIGHLFAVYVLATAAYYSCRHFTLLTLRPRPPTALALPSPLPHSCSIPWPRDEGSGSPYPPQLHDLVSDCLVVDPVQRPHVADLIPRVQRLLAAGALRDPHNCR